MQKITPHLWFDKPARARHAGGEAKDAAEFYISSFPNSEVKSVRTIHNTPSGDCDIVSFELAGQPLMAISAGPYFKFTPAISFMVNFDPIRYKASNGAGPSPEAKAREALDATWAKLSEGGKVMMPIQEYPFSKRYGWIEDKYGLSWQLILTNPEGEKRPFIIPSLLFVGDRYGKAEEASNFYLSVFKDSARGALLKYPKGAEPNKEGTVMFTDFRLFDMWFAAMDGGGTHNFDFNEAVSFIVKCDTQEEIDYYWGKLSAVPAAEQCGWLKDKYGVSWQIVPTAMDEMMASGDEKKIARVTQAFLKMKKFDIEELKRAYES